MRIPRRPPLTHGLQAWKCTAAAFKPGSQLGSFCAAAGLGLEETRERYIFSLVSRTRRHFLLCCSLV